MVSKKVVVIALGILLIIVFAVILSTGVFNPTGGVIMTGGAVGGEGYGDYCVETCVAEICPEGGEDCFDEFWDSCKEECGI
ncbi:hypothetical protein CMI41_03390 [Candidatus Pacearchaeota archaeon]|nr:hypothetical protein [Candidatus Pacearchaeota archaeon]|tara:strand:- start:11784 stop:12026 length:243 start_codon:yes stop_codon:yes gene_type:complete